MLAARICILPLLLTLTSFAQAQTEFNVFEASISQIQSALERGEATSVDLVRQYTARINAYDKQGPGLSSIVRINPLAAAVAARLDAERQASGARGPLHGVPILMKDNYNTDWMPTTGGSVALADFLPNENAAQLDKLIEAGAIILGKTTLHEYAYGITSIGSLFGQTRNPYDPRRVPGGSSGGTGAAVAASFAAAGFGSDTCGSIRIPAAFNNLIGLRPSKGLSSIYGILPLAHTQDVAGPLARSAEDLAIILDSVVGFDARDAATEIMQTQALPRFVERLHTADLGALRIGKLNDYFEDSDAAVVAKLEEALDWYAQQGAEVVEIEMPEQLAELIRRSGVIGHEFKPDLDHYLATFSTDGDRDRDLSLELDSIVSLGLYHEAVNGVLTRSNAAQPDEQAYGEALAARSELRAAVETLLAENDIDAIAYPTIRRLQVFTGEAQPGSNCSLSANSGLPALSMPVGFTTSGLPVGLELLGGFLRDAELLALAQAYESAMDSRRAPSTTPALVDGQAPAVQTFELSFERSGLGVEARFGYDVLSNLFRFELSKSGAQAHSISAVTLVIDREDDGALDDPVVLNLLAPDVAAASGSHFMSAPFRQALDERRLYLRLFGSAFPRAGEVQLIE